MVLWLAISSAMIGHIVAMVGYACTLISNIMLSVAQFLRTEVAVRCMMAVQVRNRISCIVSDANSTGTSAKGRAIVSPVTCICDKGL